jgi:hypothetical protein
VVSVSREPSFFPLLLIIGLSYGMFHDNQCLSQSKTLDTIFTKTRNDLIFLLLRCDKIY